MNNRQGAGRKDFLTARTMIWAALCMTWSANALGQEAASSAQPLDLHYREQPPVVKSPISVCEYKNHRQEQDKELQASLAKQGDGVTTAPLMTVTAKCPDYLDLHTFHNPIDYKPTAFDKYWKDKKKPNPMEMQPGILQSVIPFDMTDMLLRKLPSHATPSPFNQAQLDKQAKLWNQSNPDLPQEVQDVDGTLDAAK